MTSQRTRDYELVMILSPEATEAEAAQTVQRISEIISDGGSIAHQENWGIRRLAYPIQRFIEGNYFITRCQMEAQAATELDKTLNAAQDVMRHLLFRLEKSEIAAMEAQAERQRQELARQEAEARAAAAREAREREEAAARVAAEREARERAEAEAQQPTAEVENAPDEPATEAPSAATAETGDATAEAEAAEAPAPATAEVETTEGEQAVQETV